MNGLLYDFTQRLGADLVALLMAPEDGPADSHTLVVDTLVFHGGNGHTDDEILEIHDPGNGDGPITLPWVTGSLIGRALDTNTVAAERTTGGRKPDDSFGYALAVPIASEGCVGIVYAEGEVS